MAAPLPQAFEATKNARVARAFNRSGGRGGLFSAEECDAVIRWAEATQSGWKRTLGADASDSPSERRIGVSDVSHSNRPTRAARDRDIGWLPRKLKEIGASLNAQIWRFDVTGWSDVFLIRYGAGDRLAQHSDLNDDHCDFKITMLLQLSPADAYDGGTLEFGAPSDMAAREQGSLLAFPAWMPHRTAPITAGKRYVAACFALGPSFR